MPKAKSEGASNAETSSRPRTTVAVFAFADYVGGRLADCREKQTISETFCATMCEYDAGVEGADLQVLADSIESQIMSDPYYDSETQIAQRATRSVLRQHFGDTISLITDPTR